MNTPHDILRKRFSRNAHKSQQITLHTVRVSHEFCHFIVFRRCARIVCSGLKVSWNQWCHWPKVQTVARDMVHFQLITALKSLLKVYNSYVNALISWKWITFRSHFWWVSQFAHRGYNDYVFFVAEKSNIPLNQQSAGETPWHYWVFFVISPINFENSIGYHYP